MLFTSLEYLFLPVVLIGYYTIRRDLRNTWLLAASLVFYAYGEPKFVFAMIASILFNYADGFSCDVVGGRHVQACHACRGARQDGWQFRGFPRRQADMPC